MSDSCANTMAGSIVIALNKQAEVRLVALDIKGECLVAGSPLSFMEYWY